MQKIDPSRLKELRNRKAWSQEELSRQTQSPGLPKIDKQTISRIESGKQKTHRSLTVQSLARALGVEPAVLTGDAPLPVKREDPHMSHLNFRVSTSARNAIYLVSERYNVTYSEIVELAPFLFCWAAEACLRRRRERLAAAERACQEFGEAAEQMWHLPRTDLDGVKDTFEEERQSIESRDLFASDLEHRRVDNVFSDFLSELADEIGGGAVFNHYMWRDYPEYRICQEEASHLVGEDEGLAEKIVQGDIPLHEMPKELSHWGFTKSKERAEWARARLRELQEELHHSVERSLNAEASQ